MALLYAIPMNKCVYKNQHHDRLMRDGGAIRAQLKHSSSVENVPMVLRKQSREQKANRKHSKQEAPSKQVATPQQQTATEEVVTNGAAPATTRHRYHNSSVTAKRICKIWNFRSNSHGASELAKMTTATQKRKQHQQQQKTMKEASNNKRDRQESSGDNSNSGSNGQAILEFFHLGGFGKKSPSPSLSQG